SHDLPTRRLAPWCSLACPGSDRLDNGTQSVTTQRPRKRHAIRRGCSECAPRFCGEHAGTRRQPPAIPTRAKDGLRYSANDSVGVEGWAVIRLSRKRYCRKLAFSRSGLQGGSGPALESWPARMRTRPRRTAGCPKERAAGVFHFAASFVVGLATL